MNAFNSSMTYFNCLCVCVCVSDSIHPNLRPAIYCQALAAGGDIEWEFAWRMYQENTISPDKHLLAHALSCTKKIWLLNRWNI